MKFSFAILMMLGALSLSSCKPTPRTAKTSPEKPAEQTQEASSVPDKSPAPAEQEHTAKSDEVLNPTAAMLNVSLARQEFRLLSPWDKEEVQRERSMGVYVGNGMVLASGAFTKAVNFVELSLPDRSRTVSARIVRYDEGLRLALLSVEHEADKDFFESCQALEIGEPLKLGSTAEFWCLVRGQVPVQIALSVESGAEASGINIPRLVMPAAQAVPTSSVEGLPITDKEGKLVALASSYRNDSQAIIAQNAELLTRFMQMPEDKLIANSSTPTLGISATRLDDAVFRSYLKLPQSATGIYLSDVEPQGAAAAAGLMKGDVLLSIEGMDIDNRGLCKHPLYGSIDFGAVLRSYRPVGESLKVLISRDGAEQEYEIVLNRDAETKALIPESVSGEAPRYAVFGGMVFQPISKGYLESLRQAARGRLPVEFLQISRNQEKYREAGRTELVALSSIIASPATLGYESLNFCIVEAVNGKAIHNFKEMLEYLDEETEDGIISISINKAPYTVYLNRATVESSNAAFQRRGISKLRNTGEEE